MPTMSHNKRHHHHHQNSIRPSSLSGIARRESTINSIGPTSRSRAAHYHHHHQLVLSCSLRPRKLINNNTTYDCTSSTTDIDFPVLSNESSYYQEPRSGPPRSKYQSSIVSTRRMPRLLPTISETSLDLEFKDGEKNQSEWASLLERRRVAKRSSCNNNNYVGYYASRRPPKLTLPQKRHISDNNNRPPSPVPSLSPCDSPDNNNSINTTGYWSSHPSPHYLLPSPPTSPYMSSSSYSSPPPPSGGDGPVVYSPTKSFKQRSSEWLDTIMEDES